MSKLFISYRRDSWSFTYWLAEELAKLLDAEIFVDYAGIDEANFETSLLRNLRESDAVLLVVTAILVLRESYLRIFVHPEMPEISIWAFAVMIRWVGSKNNSTTSARRMLRWARCRL